MTMTMTSPACPVADVIVDDVESELERAVPHDMKIDVELVWSLSGERGDGMAHQVLLHRARAATQCLHLIEERRRGSLL